MVRREAEGRERGDTDDRSRREGASAEDSVGERRTREERGE